MILFVELNFFTSDAFTTFHFLETFFRLSDDADRDEEAEETDKRVDESNDLPHAVVSSVSFVVIEVDVSLEVPHHEGVKCPWDEVLNGEGPPENENRFPCRCWGVGSINTVKLIRSVGNQVGKFVGSIEEDFLIPVLGVSAFHEEGDRPDNNLNNPEDDNS